MEAEKNLDRRCELWIEEEQWRAMVGWWLKSRRGGFGSGKIPRWKRTGGGGWGDGTRLLISRVGSRVRLIYIAEEFRLGDV